MFVMELDMRKTRTLTLRVPRKVNELLEKAYHDLGYPTKSDFVREAVIEYINEVVRKSPGGLSTVEGRAKTNQRLKPAISRNARLVLIH